MVLKTPLDKIESEVERYFDGLYSRTFEQTSAFPGFVPGHWTDSHPENDPLAHVRPVNSLTRAAPCFNARLNVVDDWGISEWTSMARPSEFS